MLVYRAFYQNLSLCPKYNNSAEGKGDTHPHKDEFRELNC